MELFFHKPEAAVTGFSAGRHSSSRTKDLRPLRQVSGRLMAGVGRSNDSSLLIGEVRSFSHGGVRLANDVKTGTPVAIAQNFAGVLDVLPDGLLLVGAKGNIEYANLPACQMFGYDLEALVSQPIEVLVPLEARAAHRRNRSQFGQHPQPRYMGRNDLDIEGRRSDGTVFPLDVQLSPLPPGDTVVVVVRDMTSERGFAVDRALERLDLAAATERSTKLVESHDLMVQRLFALAAHLEAHRDRDAFDSNRFIQAIDELIAIIRREALGEARSDSS
jgi:PAS domain S-box-containing protein